jgi:uncharacterized secreted protein with C-terminal beta-propeller domain
MSRSRNLLILGCSLILIAILSTGCMSIPAKVPTVPSELKKFNSTAEIEQYLESSMALYQQDGFHPTFAPTMGINTNRMAGEMASGIGIPAPVGPGGGPGASGVPYSQTNVQVAGVDEPDIIKNDNRYIYTISGHNLVIVDAYSAADASVVSSTEIADTPRDIFVMGNRLVLFTTGTPDAGPYPEPTGPWLMPPYYPPPPPVTHAVIYDIGDRAHPRVLKDYSIDGDYLDARMVGPLVYLVTQEQVYPRRDVPVIVPALHEGSRIILQPDVWYFDHPESWYTFTTITALDAESGKEKDAQTYLLGGGNTLYVSEDAMYVSYPRYVPMIYPVRVADTGSASAKLSGIPADFNTLTGQERQSVIEGLRSAEEDAIRRKEIDQATTVIHKIAIRNGAIIYLSRGEVPGTLHNQFSMDEYEGNLRVATTSNVYTPRYGQYTYNNVYVLDRDMATIGELTHIAEQESIYATRFIGDRLYMVTFRRIDPFFVIDLAKPRDPKILGKLKIPGYSDYLHPYDGTHIIGIGKETETNDWGGVSTSGVKLALFDVSDVSNPALLSKVQIGDAGSDSAALADHHAFLFDRAKNLLVIPVRAVIAEPVTREEYSVYRPQVWYGAYVFGLTPGTGFVLRGTVQHGAGDSGYYYYGTSVSEVRRSLYIGDVLYTMSTKQIKANSLGDVNTTIATIPLSGRDVLYPVLKE